MQFQVRESDDSCQPGGPYRNPRVVVQEHHGAPLLNCSGLVLVRQLIERLGVARAIDAGVRVLRHCRWYRESDHVLTLIYSMLSGGNKLQDINRLGQDDALKRVLGSERIAHATTIGKFLWRFGDDQQDQQRVGLTELRETTEAVQQDAFGLLPRGRRKVATLDWDSSIHEVYGQKGAGLVRYGLGEVAARHNGNRQAVHRAADGRVPVPQVQRRPRSAGRQDQGAVADSAAGRAGLLDAHSRRRGRTQAGHRAGLERRRGGDSPCRIQRRQRYYLD